MTCEKHIPINYYSRSLLCIVYTDLQTVNIHGRLNEDPNTFKDLHELKDLEKLEGPVGYI